MLLIAAGVALLTQTQDPLDEAMRQAAAVQHFHAEYRLQVGTESTPTVLTIDYVAPSRIRVERRKGETWMRNWCTDGMLAVRTNEGENPVAATVAMGPMLQRVEDLETTVRRTLPDMPGAVTVPRTICSMSWGIDPRTGKAEFNFGAGIERDAATPFGWLETLRHKGVEVVREGDVLRASTDDSFEVTVAAGSGLLQEIKGRSASGSMSLVLVHADLDTPPAAECFVVPEAPAGAMDESERFAQVLQVTCEQGLRIRLFKTLAGDRGPFAGDATVEAATPVAEQALRTYHAATIDTRLAADRKLVVGRAEKFGPRLAESAMQLPEDERTPAAIATFREKGREELERKLDESGAEFAGRVMPPIGTKRLPHAAAVLQQERAVVEDLYRERVSGPALQAYFDAFDAAAAKAKAR